MHAQSPSFQRAATMRSTHMRLQADGSAAAAIPATAAAATASPRQRALARTSSLPMRPPQPEHAAALGQSMPLPTPAPVAVAPAAQPAAAAASLQAVELIQKMYEAQFIAQNEDRLMSSFWEWRKGYDQEHALFRKVEAARIEAAYASRIASQADEIAMLRSRLECSIEAMQHFENWIVNLLASVPREEGEEQHKLFQSLRPEPELLQPLPPSTPDITPQLTAPAKFKSNVSLPRFVLLPLAPFAPVAPLAVASDSPGQPSFAVHVEGAPAAAADAPFQTPPGQVTVVCASNTPSPGAPFALPQSALSTHSNLPSQGKGLFVNRRPPRSPTMVRKGDMFHHARLASVGANAGGGPGEASPLTHRRNLSATAPSPLAGTVTRRSPSTSSLVFSPVFLSNAALPSQPNSGAGTPLGPSTPGASPLAAAGAVFTNSPAGASRVRTLATANPRTGKGEAGVFLNADGRSKKDNDAAAASSSSSGISRTMPAADVMSRFQKAAAASPALTASWPKRREPQLSPRSLHAHQALEARRRELHRRLQTADGSDEDSGVELEYHTTSDEDESPAGSDSDSSSATPCVSTPNPLLALAASALVGSTPREPPSPRVVAARKTSMQRAVQRAKIGLDESSSASGSEEEEDGGEAPASRASSSFPRPKALVLSNKDVAAISLDGQPEGSSASCAGSDPEEFEDLESGNRSARSEISHSRSQSQSHTPTVAATPAPTSIHSQSVPTPTRRLASLPPPLSVSVVIEPLEAADVAESPALQLLISEEAQSQVHLQQQQQRPGLHSQQPSSEWSGSVSQSPGAPTPSHQTQERQGDSIVITPMHAASADDEASQADLSDDGDSSRSSPSQHYSARFNMSADSLGSAFRDRDVPASSNGVSHSREAAAAPMSMAASIAATIVDPYDIDLQVTDRLDGTLRYSSSLSSSLARRPSLTSTYIYPQVPKELSPATVSGSGASASTIQPHQEECKEISGPSPLARRNKLQIHPAPAAASLSRGAPFAAAPIAAVNLSSSSSSFSPASFALSSSASAASGFVANEHAAFGFRPSPLPVPLPPTAPLTPTKPASACAPRVAPSAHSSRTMTPGLTRVASAAAAANSGAAGPAMTPRSISQTMQPGSIPSAKRAIVFT